MDGCNLDAQNKKTLSSSLELLYSLFDRKSHLEKPMDINTDTDTSAVT